MKIYLAGPEVFLENALESFEQAVLLVEKAGHTALTPFDAVDTSHIHGAGKAAKIYAGNVGLIDEADAVIANLNSFRGSEPDSGTVFEVGYAVAKRKPVFGCLADLGEYKDRVLKSKIPLTRRGEDWVDEQGLSVENMGLPLNLMLGCSVNLVRGGVEEALIALSTFKWKIKNEN